MEELPSIDELSVVDGLRPNPGDSEIPTHLDPKAFQTSTDALRAKIREYSLRERANARAAINDGIRFGLGDIQARLHELEDLTEKDVHGLSTRIKRRKHATVEDMYRLSHAFLQSNGNINAFANIPGALQVIVKELTTQNAERQVYAAECLCNLSLGESHVCEKISNAVGSYLITYLDSSEERLKRTSLWTLANILATSAKATDTLLRMELIRKLWANYVSSNEIYCEDAAICLVLLSRKGKEVMKDDDLRFLFENISNKNPTVAGGEYHLEIIFNFELVSPGSVLNESQILYLVNYALSSLHNCSDLKTEKNCLRIVYAIRVLANLLASQPKAYNNMLKLLGIDWLPSLCALFNKLFAIPEKSLLSESLWLLKNVITLQNQIGGLAVEKFLEKLCIPRELIGVI